MKRVIFLSITIFFCCQLTYTQIHINRIPFSSRNYINSSIIPKKELPELDIASLLAEDVLDEQNGIPPRFGYAHEVDYDLKNSGIWKQLPNGDKIWFLNIVCPYATSINLLYDRFWLPENAEFYIYSNDKNSKLGMFSNRNNKGSRDITKGFATGLIFRESIVLEYYEPKEVVGQGIISIVKVVHGYKGFGTEDFGDSGDCQVNINCDPEGNDWQVEKQSVAMILVNGDRYCTGSLINNADLDGDPLFLTADHCIYPSDAISSSDLSTWSFWWNYESAGCSDGTDFTAESTSGATIIANNTETDFALLELDEDPLDDEIDVYYNGWNREATQPANGVGIHHPSGDLKKISTHNITPGTSDCLNVWHHGSYLPNDAFWKINWMETTNGWSVTEGGSSGSPLYTSDHRVIGQLLGAAECDNPNCSDPENDIANYGRIFSSWNRHATESRRRLRDWLEPNNILTELPGLKMLRTTTIDSDTPVNGDHVRFINVTVDSGADIAVEFNDSFEASGTFSAPSGTTLEIEPL